MVAALGPGKFYGTSLPRPRIYTDVKLNGERVDPPLPVLDPLISWANEAHWSMGGLSFTRHRLQGKIEGNVDKLRRQREKVVKEMKKTSDSTETSGGKSISSSVSPPPAPRVIKRRRFLALCDEEDDDVEEAVIMEKEVAKEKEDGGDGSRAGIRVTRSLVRKLGDDFDRVAAESNVKEKDNQNGSRFEKRGDGTGGAEKPTEEVKKGSRESKGRKRVKGKSNGTKSKDNGSIVREVRTSPRLLKRELS